MKTEYKTFITYVRTKQYLGLRLKGEGEEVRPVHIPQKEIENRFFVYPKHNRKDALRTLVEAKELKIHSSTKGKRKYLKYEALKPGDVDFNLIEVKPDNFTDPIIKRMRDQLKEVSLSAGAPSTPYFDTFLANKDKHISLFFTVDDFARRVHTPITNFHRTHRPNVLFYGNKAVSLDVTTMQPLLLGNILLKQIGKNEYSDWINKGKDIYLMLKEKANLETRDQAKKRFFEILFSPPSKSLSDMFGASDWINWINDFKRRILPANPHNKEKRYSNLAWLLQSTEVQIMYKVWKELDKNDIPFLTVHDEILIQEHHTKSAKMLFEKVLRKEFNYFRLNSKIKHPEKVNILKELETFYKMNSQSSKVVLSNCETIIDIDLFYKSHLAILKHNNNTQVYTPYLKRLIQAKKMIEGRKKKHVGEAFI